MIKGHVDLRHHLEQRIKTANKIYDEHQYKIYIYIIPSSSEVTDISLTLLRSDGVLAILSPVELNNSWLNNVRQMKRIFSWAWSRYQPLCW